MTARTQVLLGSILGSMLIFLTLSNALALEEGQASYLAKAEAAVKAQLKDPYSADIQFTKVGKTLSWFASLPPGMPIVCGIVNSKNGFGAYVGFRRVIVLAEDVVFFELKIVPGIDYEGKYIFINTWNENCK